MAAQPSPSLEATTSKIIVTSLRDWYGNPKTGAFTVYLDGSKVGKLLPRQSIEIACRPGRHVVRVRHWWYLSEDLEVIAGDDRPVRLVADRQRGQRAVIALAFMPWRSMDLREAGEEATAGDSAIDNVVTVTAPSRLARTVLGDRRLLLLYAFGTAALFVIVAILAAHLSG